MTLNTKVFGTEHQIENTGHHVTWNEVFIRVTLVKTRTT